MKKKDSVGSERGKAALANGFVRNRNTAFR